MAQTNYIENLEGKGFWIDNAYLEITLEFICDVLEKNLDLYEDWIKEHYEILKNNRLGNFLGFMDLALDYLETEKRKEFFIQILEKAKDSLVLKEEISVEELNEYESKKPQELRSTFIASLKVFKIIKILDEIIKMINEGEDYNNESFSLEENVDI